MILEWKDLMLREYRMKHISKKTDPRPAAALSGSTILHGTLAAATDEDKTDRRNRRRSKKNPAVP